MKVLVFAEWNVLHGGAEVYSLQLKRALNSVGDEVRILAADVSPQARQVADCLAPASDHKLVKSVQQIANPLAAASVRKEVRQFRPDVALINMFALYLSPSAVFALGGVPYVLQVTDYKWICPLGHRLLPDRTVCHQNAGIACLKNRCLSPTHWLRDQLRYMRINKVIEDAATIVSCSDSVRDSLAEQGIASQAIHLFSDMPEPQLERQIPKDPLFMYLGRLDVEKGVDTLLKAFEACRRKFPRARLRLLGQGEQRPALEQLARDLAIDDGVDFAGWKEPAEINRELSKAWALVAPSRWLEPFGLVALEAIFRGVPAVVPGRGGLAETVEHGVSGLVYPAENVEALSECLLSIAAGRQFPGATLDPGVMARAREKFGRERHVKQLRRVLLETCAQAAQPR